MSKENNKEKQMGWKAWPAWVKGGLIGLSVYLVYILYLIFIGGVPINSLRISLPGRIELVLIVFFIVGSIIGLVVEKIKGAKK